MNNKTKSPNGLKSCFSPLGIWAFSIGTSIGWGSFIVTCNTYLQKSGILGTVFGLLAGMAVILVITWNLQYMIGNAPDAGGIYTFEKKVGGRDLGFLVFWFVLLTYLAILWANITSVPLFARFFLGDTFKFGFRYEIFGYDVWFGEAMLSICAVVLTGILCANSSRGINRIMIVAALVFTAGFTICSVIVGVRHSGTFSYSPLYIEGSAPFAQIVRIAAISPWAFIGFENISHFSEEYTFPVKKVRKILICSVLITTALYLFVSLLSVSAYPQEYESWLAYIRDMGNLEGIKAVPAFYAASYYLGNTGVAVLMLALFGVILTSLIGNMLALSRLLYAAGRDGEASRAFAKLNKRGLPDKAVYAVVAISVFIPFLGRTAIGWIVDVTTLGATIIYGLISYAVFLSTKKNGRSVEKYTGMVGIAVMVFFLLLLLTPGLLPFHAMETESYVLFIIWSILGLIYFHMLIRKDNDRTFTQRVVVWMMLLLLVLFASMMWVSRTTENAANSAVERIYEYHQNHPNRDSDVAAEEEREFFLQEQAKHISSTNTLYSVVSLGLFLISVGIMLSNYKDNQRLGKQLTAVEEAAKRIAGLKESIGVLLDNMPALSFYKDAKTGVYLACNQAFAEYAHKKTPEEVAGLTDFEIFDHDIATHFVNDDRKALAMDKPHIFYEDVADAVGNPRQLQTTKLKFYDVNGRLCLLGMCMDVTEMEKVRKENEQAREEIKTYLRLSALNGNLIVLYIVDPENDKYTEFRSTKNYDDLGIAKQGDDFFKTSYENSLRTIHPDDRALFCSQVKKENILRAIERDGVFVLDYRLITDNNPIYVRIKAAKIIEDGKPFLIIGLLDEDAQIRHEQEFEHDLSVAKNMANMDSLTGARNKHAYVDAEKTLNDDIEQQGASEFAIVVCDINNLKLVNDTKGHKEGDAYIRKAYKAISGIFKDSPIFRVGGDEFAVICQGHDYVHIENLLEELNKLNIENSKHDDVQIAYGFARFEEGHNAETVFEHADRHMYEHKSQMKS